MAEVVDGGGFRDNSFRNSVTREDEQERLATPLADLSQEQLSGRISVSQSDSREEARPTRIAVQV